VGGRLFFCWFDLKGGDSVSRGLEVEEGAMEGIHHAAFARFFSDLRMGRRGLAAVSEGSWLGCDDAVLSERQWEGWGVPQEQWQAGKRGILIRDNSGAIPTANSPKMETVVEIASPTSGMTTASMTTTIVTAHSAPSPSTPDYSKLDASIISPRSVSSVVTAPLVEELDLHSREVESTPRDELLARQGRKHTTAVWVGGASESCPACRKMFRRRSDLKRHVRCVHERDRPFSCEYCAMRFGLRSNLKKHLNVIHSEQLVSP